jgi:predicted small lipoprotein YifL
LYGARRIGEFVVTSNTSGASSRWAIILLSAAALALAGCGRKAGLDLPPNASAEAAAQAQANADHEPAASRPSVFDPSYGTDAPPAAAKGRKQPFILDPLLDN